MQQNGAVLRIRNLTKQFGSTLALDGVDIALHPGEIHALLGQNGAGKSTLIKILAGIHAPDEGEVLWKDAPVTDRLTALPISFIHQDLGLIESMTVAENVALVAGYVRKHGFISWRGTTERAREILAQIGADIEPEAEVRSLTASEKSIVAIARSLAVDASIVVLDEPTATLPESDVVQLFSVLERLKTRGLAVVYVTHRLDEVFRLADRVTVLRNGRNIATELVKNTTPTDLVVQIVGRKLEEFDARASSRHDEVVLELVRATAGHAGPVDLRLHRGEILGLVGLRGAGHDVVGRCLFGMGSVSTGKTLLRGREVELTSIERAISHDVGFVSSKRSEEGLAINLSVRENLFLNPVAKRDDFARRMNIRAEKSKCAEVVERYAIHPRDCAERPVATLSGGNQQKVILARWMEKGSDILIMEEPTFGVDVGAKLEIYNMMSRSATDGKSILFISSDFDEVARVCHRVLVFAKGQVVTELKGDEITVKNITEYSSGARSGAA